MRARGWSSWGLGSSNKQQRRQQELRQRGRGLRIEPLEARALLTVVGITASDADADEENTATGQFTVTHDGSTSASLTVSYYEHANTTATSGSDFQALAGTVVIAASQTSATITITPVDDSDAESDEDLVLALSAVGYTVDSGNPSATVTIHDNEPTISIEATDADADEENQATGTWKVSHDGTKTSQSVTVLYYEHSTSTATPTSDYQALAYSAVIAAGQTSATITLTPVDDSDAEADETVVLALSDYAGIGYAVNSNSATATVTIHDNEPTISIEATDADEENQATGTWKVSHDGTKTSQSVTVLYYEHSTSTATPTSDYQALAYTAVIAAGQTSATITLTPVDDQDVESDETVVLALSDYAEIGYAVNSNSSTATVTIHDNEPTISIEASDADADEENQATGTWKVSHDGTKTSQSVTVLYYEHSTSTATPTSDYQALAYTVSIPAGQTSATITLTPVDDQDVESDETVVLALSDFAGIGYAVNSNSSTATVTIHDNEPTISIVASDADADEENQATGTWTVSHDGTKTSQSITVLYYEDVSSTATSGSDYQALAYTVSIPAGQTSATITLTPVDDLDVEADETVVLALSDFAGIGYAVNSNSSTATVTIHDNEPTISIVASDADADEENQATGTWNVSHDGTKTSQSVTVLYYEDVSSTATSGSDYQALAYTVSIPAGQTSATITLTPVDDQDVESDETVVAALSDFAGIGYAVNSSSSSATVTIHDNEPTISIAASDADAYEENQDTGSWVVSHDGTKTSQSVTVLYYEDVSSTATSGSDYQALAYTVEIPAGQTSATITLTPVDDIEEENDETVVLALSDFAGIGYAVNSSSSSATVTIHDDDYPEVTITADPITVLESSSSSATYTVSHDVETSRSITVPLSLSGSAINETDYSFSGASFSGGQATVTIAANTSSTTFTVTPVEDSIDEPDETVVVTVDSGTGFDVGSSASATVTITDNDAEPTIFISNVEVPEGDAAEFVVSLSGESAKTITVDYDTADGSAKVSTQDYTSASGTLTFNPGETAQGFSVTTKTDDKDDDGETFTVNLSAPVNASGTPSGTATIHDTTKDSPTNCGCECSCNQVQVNTKPQTGVMNTIMNLVGGLKTLYQTMVNPHPIIRLDTEIEGGSVPDTIKAELTLGGVANGAVYYDTSGLSLGDPIEFALQADGTTLDTDVHDWEIKLTEYRGGTPTERTFNGTQDVVNRVDSEFGNRWSILGLSELVIDSDYLLLDSPMGAGIYWSDGSGGYKTPGGFDTDIAATAGNTYTATHHDGTQEVFNSSGQLTKQVDRNGNETTFTYTSGSLTKITDAFGRETTLTYSGGEISTITDHAGRTNTFTFNANGTLAKITAPDPDGAGGEAAAEHQFAYDATTKLMTSYTDPEGKVTSYEYDHAQRIKKITDDDGNFETFTSTQVEGVVDTAGGSGTELNPETMGAPGERIASNTDQLGNTTYTTTDRYGRVTSFTDADGNKWTYERDDDGRLTKLIEPKADGSPGNGSITTYTYDSNDNLTGITYADSTSESWTYESTFNEITSHTDTLGQVTNYEIDSGNGNLLSMTLVVGQVDSPQNQETDDLKTSYTYTTGTGDLPAGLLLTITDPESQVTAFGYYDSTSDDRFGWLETITLADGTADEVTTTYDFNDAGNLISEIDPLGRQADLVYDNIDRLTTLKLPYPDLTGVVLDDGDTVPAGGYVEVGNWTTQTGGNGGQHSTNAAGSGNDTATWTFDDLIDGVYEVFVTWVAGGSNATDAPYTVKNDTTSLGTVDVDQTAAADHPIFDGWTSLGTYTIDSGKLVVVLTDNADGTVVADGVKVVAARPEYSYDYNSVDNVVSETDPLGNTTTYAYDDLHQVTSVTAPDPDGAGSATSPVKQFGYDAAGNVTRVTDPLGNVISYNYDDRQLLKSILEPYSDTTGTTIDNGEADYSEVSGTWTSVGTAGHDGDYAYATDTATVSWTFDELRPGASYQIFGTWVADAANSADATFQAYDDTTFAGTTDVDQTAAPDGVAFTGWESLGTVEVTSGTLVVKLIHDGLTSDRVAADAIKVVEARSKTKFDYDALGRLEDETDPLGNVTSFEYDSVHNLTKITLPDPDAPGSGASSPVYTYTYDDGNRLTKITDPLSRDTSYAYNRLSQVTTLTLPDLDGAGGDDPPEYAYTYDGVGKLLTVTDALDNVTTYTYDDLYRLTKITLPDPDGAGGDPSPEIEYEFDDALQLTKVIDPLDNETVYAYDGVGRVIQVTLPEPDVSTASPVYSYAYDVSGTLVVETDADGNATTYAHDNLYRLLSVTLPDPTGTQATPVYDYEYDALGRVTKEADPEDRETTYSYDGMNRLIGVTLPDPDGAGGVAASELSYVYDAAYNLLSETDPLGNTTDYTYDNLYRLTKIEQPDPDDTGSLDRPTTTFVYDAVGNQTSLTDPVDNVTTWVYDALDRVTSETNELNDTRSYEYDFVGNLTKYTDRNGKVTENTYDNLYRLTQELWKDGASTVNTLDYTYDLANRLTDAEDDYSDYAYTYDGLDRITQVGIDNGGPLVRLSQEFDALSRRTKLASEFDADGQGYDDDFVTDYSYDELSRLTRIEQQGVGGGNAVAEKRIDFTYNLAGQFDAITRYKNLDGGATNEVVTTSYTYDDMGRLTDLTHQHDSTTITDYDWAYDLASRVTDFDIDHVGTTYDRDADYTYDDTGQLTDTTHTGFLSTSTYDEDYDFDENGNRTNTGYVTGDSNQLIEDGTYRYENDDEGNRTRRYVDDDSSDTFNTGDTDITEYEWDHRNRLVKVTEYAAHGGSATKEVEYTYDIFDRRIEKSVDDDGAGSGTADVTHYVYDGEHIILAFDGDGDLTNRYLHGPVIDQILADEQVTSTSSAGDVIWPLADNLGTVRDLIDSDGNVDNHLTYDGFGNIIDETDAAVDHIFGYTGRETDEETDLYFYRARYYDPVTGRFVSEDPIGFAAGDPNLHRYVGNSATKYVDPSGLKHSGHHFVPWSIFDGRVTPAVQGVFDGDGATISNKYYTNHNYSTYGGISHDAYNSAVREELRKHLGATDNNLKSKLGRMSATSADAFLDHLSSLSDDHLITRFNCAVRKEADHAYRTGMNAYAKLSKTAKTTSEAFEEAREVARFNTLRMRDKLNRAAGVVTDYASEFRNKTPGLGKILARLGGVFLIFAMVDSAKAFNTPEWDAVMDQAEMGAEEQSKCGKVSRRRQEKIRENLGIWATNTGAFTPIQAYELQKHLLLMDTNNHNMAPDTATRPRGITTQKQAASDSWTWEEYFDFWRWF